MHILGFVFDVGHALHQHRGAHAPGPWVAPRRPPPLSDPRGDPLGLGAHRLGAQRSEHTSPESGRSDFHKDIDIHVHVPEGATPKDGPSAGITMASALLSLALGQAPSKGFAMTGELTLTGHVLAIGGVREKVIAAKRQGIHQLIVPEANRGDVEELPAAVKEGVTFYFANQFKDVAKLLFPTQH